MWQQRQRRIQRRIGPTSQAFWTDEHIYRPIQDTEKQKINKETQDKYNLPHEDRYRSLYLNKAKNLCVCLFIVNSSFSQRLTNRFTLQPRQICIGCSFNFS